MGHSSSEGGTTQKYIDTFPIEMQMEYNAKLLNTKKQSTRIDDILAMAKEMSDTEKARLIDELLKNKNLIHQSEGPEGDDVAGAEFDVVFYNIAFLGIG